MYIYIYETEILPHNISEGVLGDLHFIVVLANLIQGIVDPVLGSLAKCARSKKNECRNLHRHIHATGRTFPVEISGVPTPVRVLSGKPRNTTVSYPVLFLSSWCRECFKDGGNMLLGGYSLSEDQQWRPMFREFWRLYKFSRPDLDLYKHRSFNHDFCVPIQIHGDEGRGKGRRPLMVVSYQPVIGCKGPLVTNASGPIDQVLGIFWVRVIVLHPFYGLVSS